MKKIYLSLLAIAIVTSFNAQDAFWNVTNYRGAFPITDNTPATDWTAGWSNFDPQTTVYPAIVTTVSTDVLVNTTWSGVVKLQNKIYVKNNATLTILPGTIIRGDKLTQATLIVTRGAKIYANGTAANPVIFTSNEAPGTRLPGDWGGLVLLGLAKNNQPGGVANIEGIVPTTDTQFGGNFDNDNSGSLTYVRIEFAGIALEPNKEINGLTCGSVGSATVIDYVQITSSGDDSFEWFGGTVNCKHLIAYRGLDDDFDTDYGYRGKIQFGLSIRDKDLSDAIGDSNSFESDNDNTGSTAQPKTRPIFSNMTLVGPKGNGTIVLPVGEKFEKAFRLRRNTSTSCLNSLVVGWEKGLSIESATTAANATGDSLMFASNTMTNFTNGTNVITSSGVSGAFYASFFGVDGNDSTVTLPLVNWVNIFTALGTTPDARLIAGSTVSTTANFTNPKFFSVLAPVVTNSATYCQNAIASAINGTPLVGNTLYYYTTAVGGTGSITPIVPSTTTPGIYTYYVSQKNAAGDESPRSMITVTINPAPTVSGGTNQSICAGTSVTLTGSGAVSYTWDNGVNNGVSFIPTATTTYSVIGTAANGCTNNNQVTVTVNSLPTINAGINQTVCAGTSVTLNASGASTYAWNNAVSNGVSFIPAATTTYTVTGTAVNGCTNTALVTVTVNALPATPVITASGSTSFCTGSSINLTSSYNNNNVWSTGAISPIINVANSGVITVTYTNANGCSATSAPTSINVSAAPQPTVQVSSNQVCTGDTVILTASTSDSYLWSTGQTTQSILITATTPSITVTVTNAIACNGTGTSQPVTVTIVTTLPTVSASSLTACSGDTVTLTSSPADSYTWSTGQTTQSISISATTTASVTTTNSNACNGYGMSQATTVTFTSTPTAAGAFTTNGNVVSFTNTSTGAASYSWDFGDQSNSSAIAPSHAYIGNGVYVVTLTAINGACTDVITFDVIMSVGIDELTGLSNVNIYPNPANDLLNIDYNKNGDDVVEISIIDQFGRVITSINGLSNGFNHNTIDVSNLQSAVYFVRFTTNGFSKSERLVIR
jgi:hypothetical protein